MLHRAVARNGRVHYQTCAGRIKSTGYYHHHIITGYLPVAPPSLSDSELQIVIPIPAAADERSIGPRVHRPLYMAIRQRRPRERPHALGSRARCAGRVDFCETSHTHRLVHGRRVAGVHLGPIRLQSTVLNSRRIYVSDVPFPIPCCPPLAHNERTSPPRRDKRSLANKVEFLVLVEDDDAHDDTGEKQLATEREEAHPGPVTVFSALVVGVFGFFGCDGVFLGVRVGDGARTTEDENRQDGVDPWKKWEEKAGDEELETRQRRRSAPAPRINTVSKFHFRERQKKKTSKKEPNGWKKREIFFGAHLRSPACLQK